MKTLFSFLILLPTITLAQPGVLLITSPELKDSWQKFAEWKSSRGKPVEVLTTAEIDQSQEGPDIQEKIRRCVRDQIGNHDVRWVILGGDSQPGGKGIVPDRDTFHETMWGRNEDIPTDIYYISPTNWDADEDGIYGEFKDDREAISYPDGTIGLGRIPVRTAADVAAYTAKVIEYESSYPVGDFRNTITYTCTVAGAYPKVRRSWDDHVSKVLDGGTVHRYFENETPWDTDKPGDYALSPANWVSMINDGKCGKYHFHGHGLHHCWVLEEHEEFTAKHVAKLKNKGSYPLITTVSCFTGHYDADQDPCIAESMLRIPNAGTVAIVAPCREGKPHFTNPERDFQLMAKEGKLDGTTRTMTLFWEMGIRDQLTTGEALMKAKQSMAEEATSSTNLHMCLAELNLLGDPTLAVHPQPQETP